ncbi:MAG: hypothetical protein HY330_01350 [Chloroflexi bacterium]|nr:hypothetical protein [Chloroflexota bacterium]
MPVRVTKELLRALFRELQLLEKLEKGFISARVYWQGKHFVGHLPAGATSLIVEYVWLDGKPFALVHEYRDLAGRRVGLPDPKYLRISEVSLFV